MKDDAQPGENCTGETKRDFLRKLIRQQIAVDDAAELTHSRKAAYRTTLKEAKKAGCNTKALTTAVAQRLEDSEDLVLEYREVLTMLDLGGIAPGILDKIAARTTIQEPTRNETHENAMLRAFDIGSLAGRKGIDAVDAAAGHFDPGTEYHVEFMKGWNSGQAALAAVAFPTPPAREPAPRKSARKQAAPAPNVSEAIAREFADEPAEVVTIQ